MQESLDVVQDTTTRILRDELVEIGVYVMVDLVFFELFGNILEPLSEHASYILPVLPHEFHPVREIVECQFEPVVDAAQGLREGVGDLPLDNALKLFESRVEVRIVLDVKLVSGVT
jgi:hypothetical protein